MPFHPRSSHFSAFKWHLSTLVNTYMPCNDCLPNFLCENLSLPNFLKNNVYNIFCISIFHNWQITKVGYTPQNMRHSRKVRHTYCCWLRKKYIKDILTRYMTLNVCSFSLRPRRKKGPDFNRPNVKKILKGSFHLMLKKSIPVLMIRFQKCQFTS